MIVTVDGAQDRLRLVVEDEGVGYGRSTDRRGAGSTISGLERRLALLHGDRARLTIARREPRGTTAVIELPRGRPEGEATQ